MAFSILLEGPDNSGKTTLAKELAKNLNLEYEHGGGPPENTKIATDRCTKLFAELKSKESRKIYDRTCAISELVYRNGPGKTPLIDYVWTRNLSTKGNLAIIYCKPPIKQLMDIQSSDFREEETEEHKNMIMDNRLTYITRYEEVFSTVNHIHYDYTQFDLHKMQLLLTYLSSRIAEDVCSLGV